MTERRAVDDNRDDDAPLSAELASAIACLRIEEPMPSEWRRSLIDGVERARRRQRLQRRLIGFAGLAAAAALCAVVVRPANRGVISVGDAHAVHFELDAPHARRVSLVGDFDGWNPAAIPMRRRSDGAWAIDLPLPPGRHAFAFSVDGRLTIDPTAALAADDNFGVPSSVVVVTATGRQ